MERRDLESVVSRLGPDLLRFCIGVSGDPATGEELAQEALTALVRYWRREGPPDSPPAFAFTVARRAARRARVRRRLLLPLGFLLEGQPHPGPNPHEAACQRSELSETLAALRGLAPRDREAILLAASGNHSVDEASRILGISASAFKMRLHRARRRLSSALEWNHEEA